jgi:acid phosphatase
MVRPSVRRSAAATLAVVTVTLFALSPLRAIGRRQDYPSSVHHMIVFVLENEQFLNAESKPYLGELAKRGAVLRSYKAITHPSRPNYIALISGSTHGVKSDDTVNLDARHLGDLLEERKRTWKVYAEGYPGNCYLGDKGPYARRHTAFLDFVNVQKNPARCANVVEASQLDRDAAAHKLPTFALYVPDNNHNGHDTNVAFADKWLRGRLEPMLQDPKYSSTLFVITFDEDDYHAGNRIYTVLLGAGVKKGVSSNAPYDHYSLLRTIEELFDLATLHQNDEKATAIGDVWDLPAPSGR